MCYTNTEKQNAEVNFFYGQLVILVKEQVEEFVTIAVIILLT